MKGYQPVQEVQRITSLDVIRGFALLGILLMNIHGMGLPFAYADPTIAGGSEGSNLQVWMMNNLFFEGTMRGLFTVIYGASAVLLLNKLENRDASLGAADIYYRRVMWLLLFGLIHAYVLLWWGEILYSYALFGFLLFPLRKTAPKWLLTAAMVLISFGIFLDVADYYEMDRIYKEGPVLEQLVNTGTELNLEQETTWEAYQEALEKHPKEEIAGDVKVKSSGTYGEIFKAFIPVNRFMQSKFTYRYDPWDLLSFMLLGMAFFKWGILQNQRSTGFYLLMTVLGYGLGVLVNYYESLIEIEANWDSLAQARAHQSYHVGRLLITLGHIGAVMLMVRWRVLSFLQKAVAAVGRMALTNYVMHSVIAAFVFYGFGWGLYGQLERYELYYVVFSVWILQLITSPLWLRYFHFGPLEWVWRSLTYKKRQTFRR